MLPTGYHIWLMEKRIQLLGALYGRCHGFVDAVVYMHTGATALAITVSLTVGELPSWQYTLALEVRVSLLVCTFRNPVKLEKLSMYSDISSVATCIAELPS